MFRELKPKYNIQTKLGPSLGLSLKDWIKLIKIQYRNSTKRGYVQLHFYILDHHKRGNYYRYITIRPKDTIKN